MRNETSMPPPRPRRGRAIVHRVYPLLIVAMAASAARADRIVTATRTFDGVSVSALRAGAVVAREADGASLRVPLREVITLQIDGATALSRAEADRAAQAWRKAADDYTAALRATDDPDLRRLVEARSIAALDAGGQWLAAVQRFIDIYTATPDDGTWALRPTHLPEAGSSLLGDSAKLVEQALASPPLSTAPGAARHLRSMLLDIYNQANDPRAADVARELAAAAPPTTAASMAAPGDGFLQAAKLALDNGNADDALRLADDGLKAAGGATAAGLHIVRAAALEKQGKPGDAVAELLKVPVFYPDTAEAPEALRKAAALEDAQGNHDAAARLREQLAARYPKSAAAPQAAGGTP